MYIYRFPFSSRSVAWLADEAYRRRQILTGKCAFPTAKFSDNVGFRGSDAVRLSTRDGALLLPTDRLHSVLPVLSHASGTAIELLAELLVPDLNTSDNGSAARSSTIASRTAIPSVQLVGGIHPTPSRAVNPAACEHIWS